MNKINFKKAFTMLEVFVALVIIAFVSLLTVRVYGGIKQHLNDVKIENATMEFKNALNNVITNSMYYKNDGDLADMDMAFLDNTNDSQSREFTGVSKFKGLMFFELGVHEDEKNTTSCYVMSENKEIKHSGTCYVGTNNIVWYIPNTDFVQNNILETSNASGSIYKYVPITIYPASAFHDTEEDFEKFALVYGIRRDGDITIINSVDCNDKKYKNYNQCRNLKISSFNKG